MPSLRARAVCLCRGGVSCDFSCFEDLPAVSHTSYVRLVRSTPESRMHRGMSGKVDEKDAKSNSQLKCAVVGATGAIGKEVVDLLLVREEVASVTVLVRRANSFPENKKLTEKVIDFDKLDGNDFKGFDVFFCCLGSTIKKAGSQAAFRKVDYDGIVAVGQLAKAGGTRHLALVSSVGAASNSGTFYLKVKGEAEDALRALRFDMLTIYRPSVLEANRGEARCGEGFAVCCLNYICCCVGCCCPSYSAINVRTVGLAMVREAIRLLPKAGAAEVRVYDGSAECEAAAASKTWQ